MYISISLLLHLDESYCMSAVQKCKQKGQGRKRSKHLYWTLSVLNFTVSNKPLEAIFKIPTMAL